MKKLFALIPVLFLLVLPAHAEDYTPIGSPEELVAIFRNPNGSYILTEDLDMSGVEWQCFDFGGVLNGDGHAILNLTVTQPGENTGITYDGNQKTYDTRFAGLFATADQARIENLNLVNIRARVESDEPCFLGSFAGCSRDSVITGCTVSGTLELRAHDRMFGVGGVVGYGSGTVEGSSADVTLICTDTDAQTKDEQFLGGVFATGFMSVRDCTVSIDGYVSDHGYVHSGGITGMLMQYPLGSGKEGQILRNWIMGKITFFEDNTDRRAYCKAIAGETLVFNCRVADNTEDFLRDERMEYEEELRPEMCVSPAYSKTEIPSSCGTFGYTQYTCDFCGYSYRDDYKLRQHNVTHWETAVPATVQQPGDSVGFCDGCGREFHQQIPCLIQEVPETQMQTLPAQPEPTDPMHEQNAGFIGYMAAAAGGLLACCLALLWLIRKKHVQNR